MTLVQIESPALKARSNGEAEARQAQERRSRWSHLRPDSAQIYVENRCHLKCAHCYETEETHPGHESLSLGDYQRIFEELADLGVLYLTLTGGEVFLRRDFLEIVAEARRQRFHITVFTSGTLINEAKADRLAELKVNVVEISLYSHDPDVHDAFTQIPGSHARTVKAVRWLVARGVEVLVKSNILRFNVDHLDELIGLAADLGAEFQLNPVVKEKMNGDQSPLKWAISDEELRTKVYNRPDLYPAFRKAAPEDYCTGNAGFLTEESTICGAARKTMSIGADGGLYACGLFASSAGNLKEQSLEELWFGAKQLDAIRATSFGNMKSCGDCSLNKVCTPCMAYSEIESGDHTSCTQSSKRVAQTIANQIQRRLTAERKMSGRELPLCGEREVTIAEPTSRPRLSAEP